MDIDELTGESDQSQNYNFVQVSREHMRDWRALTRKNPLASEILMYLVEHMARNTNAVICSYMTLMDVTGTSRASVGRALKVLKDDNWIDSVRVGSATAYAINARVFWRSGRNMKKFAVFQATVIASESEQDRKPETLPRLKYIPIVGENLGQSRIITNTDELSPPDQKDLSLD